MKRKIIKISASVLAFFVLWIVVNSFDSASHDTSGMNSVSAMVPAQDNAYSQLSRLSTLLAFSEYTEDLKQTNIGRRIDAHLYETEWDEAFINKLLKNYAAAFEVIDNSLAMKDLKLPEMTKPDSPLAEYQKYVIAARLLALQSMAYEKQGKIDLSLAQIYKILALGHMIQIEKSQILISYWIGRVIQDIGYMRMHALSNNIALTPAQSREFGRIINSSINAEHDGFREIFHGEYRFSLMMFDFYAGLDLSQRIKTQDSYYWVDTHPIVQYLFPYYFHLNESKTIHARYLRLYSNESGKVCNELNLPKVNQSPWYYYLEPNAFGKYSDTDFSHDFYRRCRGNVRAAGIALVVALNAYKNRQGELPDALNQLVPDYIEVIPLDSFDGKPMRYSKQNKWVYSVGMNGQDDGGAQAGIFIDRYGCQSNRLCENNLTIPIDHALVLPWYRKPIFE